eukprot:2523051-Amphidinium_carterae.1
MRLLCHPCSLQKIQSAAYGMGAILSFLTLEPYENGHGIIPVACGHLKIRKSRSVRVSLKFCGCAFGNLRYFGTG